MEHQPPKTMRRLGELVFGTFDVCTVVIKVVSDIDRIIYSLLRPLVIELHEEDKREGNCKTFHNLVSCLLQR